MLWQLSLDHADQSGHGATDRVSPGFSGPT
jgi:hypothetical protein